MSKVRYRNEYVKKWGERAAAARFHLRPKEQYAYDGVARSTSPDPLEPGDWVEVKTCKRWVENGDDWGTAGRWYITQSSHEKLLDANGYYALIVYDLVEHAGGDRMLIHGMRLISASDLDDYLGESPRLSYREIIPEAYPEHGPHYNGGRESGESGDSRAASEGMTHAISNSEAYPEALSEYEIWCVWAFDGEGRKRPRAPWSTGHCYPVSWGEQVSNRPEATFEEAHRWSKFRESDIRDWPFPDDAADTNLKLGMFLPHEPPEPPIMQIDLDDVREPETGELTQPARELLSMFDDAYAMISVSGTGIHIYVRGCLPDRMGKFIADFDLQDPELGQLEMYDHGRFAAITGQHIEGTSTDVPEAQDRIHELIEEYETINCDSCDTTHRRKRFDDPEEAECPECGGELQTESEFDPDAHRSPSTPTGNRSPYYDEPIARFGEPKANHAGTGEGFGGAHPGHGGTSSADSESTNYAVNTSENAWHCFAHQSGGGPLALVAVIEGELPCSNPRLGMLSDEAFARVCLAARDTHGFSGDPPYRALVGVARSQGLAMADSEEGILGKDAYEVARMIYDSMNESDL